MDCFEDKDFMHVLSLSSDKHLRIWCLEKDYIEADKDESRNKSPEKNEGQKNDRNAKRKNNIRLYQRETFGSFGVIS